MTIIDAFSNFRRTTNNPTATANQNESAEFNYLPLLTGKELNGIPDDPYGEEGSSEDREVVVEECASPVRELVADEYRCERP